MNNISEKLDENIERYLDELGGLAVSDDKTSKAIGNVARLHGLRMNELRFENEKTEKERQRTVDIRRVTAEDINRREEQKERKKDRWFRFGVAAAEIILPLATYGVLAYIGYAREFDGTITSDTLKQVVRSIKKK